MTKKKSNSAHNNFIEPTVKNIEGQPWTKDNDFICNSMRKSIKEKGLRNRYAIVFSQQAVEKVFFLSLRAKRSNLAFNKINGLEIASSHKLLFAMTCNEFFNSLSRADPLELSYETLLQTVACLGPCASVV